MYLPLWIKLRKNKKPPCLSGQQERKGRRGCEGGTSRGVHVGSDGLYLCWFGLKHWQ